MKTKDESWYHDKITEIKETIEGLRRGVMNCVSERVSREEFVAFGIAIMNYMHHYQTFAELNDSVSPSLEELCRDGYGIYSPTITQKMDVVSTLEKLFLTNAVICDFEDSLKCRVGFMTAWPQTREDGTAVYKIYLSMEWFNLLWSIIDESEKDYYRTPIEDICIDPGLELCNEDKHNIVERFAGKKAREKAEIMGAFYDLLSERVVYAKKEINSIRYV